MTNPTPAPLSAEQLDKLEALAKAATKWKSERSKYGQIEAVEGREPHFRSMSIACAGSGVAQAEANTDFLAAANPDTILALIAQARTARLDTTASASIYVRKSTLDHIAASGSVKHDITVRTEPNEGWVALVIQQAAAKAPIKPLEEERADFEDWFMARFDEPLQSQECARQWSAWLARSTGEYKARDGWKVSPQPWGIDAFPVAAKAPAAQAVDARAILKIAKDACESISADYSVRASDGKLNSIRRNRNNWKRDAAGECAVAIGKLIDAAPASVKASSLLRDFANEIKGLCNDFSSRTGNVYVIDLQSAIDGLYVQYVLASPASTPEASQQSGAADICQVCGVKRYDPCGKVACTAYYPMESQQAAAVAAPSVDTPELRRLVNGYRHACEMVRGHAVPQWRTLVAYVASLAAPTAAAATTGEDARDDVRTVLDEVARATRKFPTWPTDPLHAVAVLGEEFGELTKAVLQMAYEPHKVKEGELHTEAIQTAAMALRFVASLDRYEFVRCAQHEQPAMSAPNAIQKEGAK